MSPVHEVYCEPFFGSGAVFFTKPPASTETINDIDGNIINLFRVIRNAADELAKAIEMTPYSRDEFYASYEEGGDEIERARRFLVRTWQSIGGKTACRTGWGHDRTNQVFRPRYWATLPARILQTVERLRMAQIESMDALDLIGLYNRPGTLLYVDPPYLRSTRSCTHYKHEFHREQDHVVLLELCRAHRGYCIVSSYANELYDDMLAGWTQRHRQVQINSGASAIETLYLNPACTREISLFG